MIIAVAVVGVLVGLWLLGFGLKGRTIGSDPHCRACGFNLDGLIASAQARCPECGADLGSSDAIVIGRRHRRRGALAAGALLSGLAAVLLAAMIWTGVRSANWNSLKPGWLLEREARSASPTAASSAMTELGSRLTRGVLDPERRVRVLGIALARQADRTASWDRPWGEFLESARAAGHMTPAQVESYARNAVFVTVDARPRIAAGNMLYISARVSGQRIGERAGLRVNIRNTGTFEGQTQLSRGGGGGSMGLAPSGVGSMGSSVRIEGPPGERVITSVWEVRVVENRDHLDDGATLAQWELKEDLRITVLPEGSSTVEVVPDESLRPAVEAALRAGTFEVSQRAGRWMMSGMVNANGLPVPAAFDVVVAAADGTEWSLGTVNFPGSGGFGYGVSGEVASGFAHTVIDVKLRPSQAAAERTTDLFRIWGGEVVIRGVKVKLPEAVGEEK